MNTLVSDIVYEICKYLNPLDLLNLRMMNKDYVKFMSLEKIWKEVNTKLENFLDFKKVDDNIPVNEEMNFFEKFKKNIREYYSLKGITFSRDLSKECILINILKPIMIKPIRCGINCRCTKDYNIGQDYLLFANYRHKILGYSPIGIVLSRIGDTLFLDGTNYPGYEHIFHPMDKIDMKKYPELRFLNRKNIDNQKLEIGFFEIKETVTNFLNNNVVKYDKYQTMVINYEIKKVDNHFILINKLSKEARDGILKILEKEIDISEMKNMELGLTVVNHSKLSTQST